MNREGNQTIGGLDCITRYLTGNVTCPQNVVYGVDNEGRGSITATNGINKSGKEAPATIACFWRDE